MRQLLLPFLLASVACGGPVGEVAAPSPARAPAVPPPILVELPVPALASRMSDPLPRSTVVPGRHALVVSSSAHFGCSRSWQTTSTRATATLELAADTVSVKLDSRTNSTIGSRGRGSVDHATYVTALELRGPFVETGPRRLRATLGIVACDGDCPTAPIEITCEEKTVAFEERDDPARSAGQSKAGTRSAPGWVCSGLGSLIRGGQDHAELPFGRGAGFELASSEWGAPQTFLAAAGP